MTLHEVERTIRKAYSEDHHILNPEEAMVLVSLQRPRIHRVLVVRQEANTTLMTSTQPGSVNIGTSGKGTARIVTLKAYENDVLHALAQGDGVDGLPGLNAKNVIYIIRRRSRGLSSPACPPLGPVPTPVPGSVSPVPEGLNGHSAFPATSSLAPRSSVETNRIQLVGYEESPARAGSQPPVITPQPYGSYRGMPEPAAHSLMNPSASMNSPSLPARNGPIASSVVVPGPYQNTASPAAQLPVTQTQYQMAPVEQPAGGFVPGSPLPSAPIPAMPVEPGGHSWGTLPPPAPMDEPGMNGPSLPDLNWNAMLADFDPTIDNPNIIRIPVRLGPGEQPNLTEELITLYDGDIVFIDSRETEVFYTAGLLGGGQYTLPRDYDLGVLEAVSIAEGRSMGGGGGGNSLNRSIGGVSALNHDVSNSASRLAILRTLPNGKRITIEVDLNKAMRYQQENIRIQPGDILFLEYTLPEAICAFSQRYLFEGAIFSLAASQFQSNR